MVEVGENLTLYFRKLGMRQEDVAKRFGVSQAYVNVLLTGKRPFGKKTAALWANEFGFSEGWLLTGKGPMMAADQEKIEEARVPLLPENAFAGNLEAVSNSIMEYDCEQIPCPYPTAQMAIRISGRSMEPEFPEGCVVFIKKVEDSSFLPWGYPHIVDTVNGIFLKNIFESGSDEYLEARSVNPQFPPFRIPYSAVYGFYQVLGMQHSFGAK